MRHQFLSDRRLHRQSGGFYHSPGLNSALVQYIHHLPNQVFCSLGQLREIRPKPITGSTNLPATAMTSNMQQLTPPPTNMHQPTSLPSNPPAVRLPTPSRNSNSLMEQRDLFLERYVQLSVLPFFYVHLVRLVIAHASTPGFSFRN
jgi:hypothetical protein